MPHRILVIEDNSDIAHLVELHLQDLSYTVDLAADGHGGLTRARSGDYDLVSSYQLPGLREAVSWIGDSSRLLYGSDWPLTPMKDYIEFIRALFPDYHDQEKVFYKNALRLFNIKRS